MASLHTVNDNMWRCCLLFFYVVGRDFNGRNEVLQMTSGERKCWNVTILDDSISEARRRYYGRPDEEWFHISLWPIRASFRSTDTTVYIIDNDRGIYSCSFHVVIELSLIVEWVGSVSSYCSRNK